MLLLNFTDILTGIYILCLILYSFQVFINSVANESIVASINLDWRDDLLSRQYSLYRGNVILRKYLSMMHGQRVRVVYIRSTCCVDIILYTSLSLYVSHPFFYRYMYLYACTRIRMLAYTHTQIPCPRMRGLCFIRIELEKFGDHKERFMRTIGLLSGRRSRLKFSALCNMTFL